MSADLGIISADEDSGSVDLNIVDKVYSITLSSRVGGYCEFLKLLEFDHKIVPENSITIAFESYVFTREEVEKALNSLDNELFKKWVLEDISTMRGKYFYLYLM